MPIAATRGAAARGALGRARRRRVPHRRASSASRCRSRCRASTRQLLDPRSTWRDPDAYDRQGARARADVPRRTSRRSSRRAARGRGGRPARLVEAGTLPRAFAPVARSVQRRTWKRSTTSSSSAPAARACARRSRRTTQAPTSASSRSCTRRAATPARPRAASTRRSATPAEDDPETHAFDTVKGSDYLGDQDAIEILSARGARRHLPARALGRVLLAPRRRQARAASVRRRRLAAHGLRRRHHRPRPDPGALRAAREAATSRSTRSSSPGSSSINDDRCQGVICWDLLERRPEDDRRQDGRPRDRRRGPPLPRDDERLRVHRRRHGDGAARRAAAEGHGVHAVPPDDALPVRDPASPRAAAARARYLINKDGERFMKQLRAERDGARLARRRLALGADRDRRGPRRQRLDLPRHAPPRRRADHRAAARARASSR